MRQTCIGIHVHAEPHRLGETLASVRAHTSLPYDLVLLPDGPDTATAAYLRTLHEIPQSGTTEAIGPPACFNRLAAASDADILVLLESGALVGPDWLDRLLAALDADPRNGIAGPSTNHAWNEQAVVRQGGRTMQAVADIARDLAQRFGSTTRTLEPLHSLADFCYVVRREVVEAIGAADEGYGLGPCWEMDYNIRAARAGFRAVWACGAYVQRAPFTARRRREERARFEASKRRYQDKFCGLRLTGQRTGNEYEPHCRGEACEQFAPAHLIPIHLPSRSIDVTAEPSAPPSAPVAAQPQADSALVSCIMPTGNRARFALQAIRSFQRQDYPRRELIIVDDGDDDLERQIPNDPAIRYLRMPRRLTIGAKRNRACEIARGALIAHWDDDDWYAPNRLRVQAAPLLAGEADITGLRGGVIVDLPRWEFWTCTPELHRRLFVHDVHGGTLVFQRRLWEQCARYPNRSLAEDALFLHRCVRRRARLAALPNDGLFVYVRHASNSWSFECGRHLDPQGWQRVAEPDFPPDDRAFYSSLSPAAPQEPGRAAVASPAIAARQPLVSCIMPTANRRRFVPHAIAYFLRQDYPQRELVIIDDGDDAIQDLLPADGRIRYVRLEGRRALGLKRNIACQHARGEIIVHWDDDDWMAGWRISAQVEELRRTGADICGLDRLMYVDLSTGDTWQYTYPGRPGTWVAGNTFCYTRELWNRNPFISANVSEDTRFLRGRSPKKIAALSDTTICVGTIHPDNTSRKNTNSALWQRLPIERVRELVGEDMALFEALMRNQHGDVQMNTTPAPQSS